MVLTRHITESIFLEASCGNGSLTFVDGIPVLRVSGSPAEVGHQHGELALRPANRLLDYPLDYLRSTIRFPLLTRPLWYLLRRRCARLYRNIPARYRAELEGIARCGFDRERIIAGNTLFDLSQTGLLPLFGCSAWVVPASHSETGGILFGRNLDFFPVGYLHKFSLVTVYEPSEDRLGFASIAFPGVIGCFSGINQAGLCLARNEVFGSNVKSTFNPAGTPFGICFRHVLETCRTVAEAQAAIERMKHVTVSNLILCDPHGGVILEIAPEAVRARPLTSKVRACTNHFLHPGWGKSRPTNDSTTRDRLARLEQIPLWDHISVDDVRNVLDEVHQNELTIQTMVFEPAALAVHVVFGAGPTTRLPLVRIDLDSLWQTESN